MAIFALTIFTSAFLLFQVQPLIGRFILPRFGGTPAVWTTCMLFFQILLLFGYTYAHLLSVRLSPRRQAWVHGAVVLTAFVFIPILPGGDLGSLSMLESPILAIFFLLAASVGLPYFVLSSTGPLIQQWFARACPGRSPYRLYALSNTGSLLALLSYPVVFEPLLRLQAQARLWSGLFLLFALGSLACAWLQSRRFVCLADSVPIAEPEDERKPGWGRIFIWLALSASGSAMLLATTNQLCQDVASVPFLWVLPLAIYLLSFILCFDNPKGYERRCWITLLAVLVPVGWLLFFLENFWLGVSFEAQMVLYSGVLLVCCMACHGEMVRSRPAAAHLTLFYMVMSIGGALGGVLVGLLAPLFFSGYWEYGIALGACSLFPLLAQIEQASFSSGGARCRYSLVGLIVLQAVIFAGVSAWATGGSIQRADKVSQFRNFYGVLRVQDELKDEGPVRLLVHGKITHGLQFLAPGNRSRPTAYYGLRSGAGQSLRLLAEIHPSGDLGVGVVGLGAGTLAVYGRSGDRFEFYEINPEVIASAGRDFTFLSDSRAGIEVHEGDGRIVLEKQLVESGPREFDVLVIDAFSGDAIPVHLLTKECVAMYLKHLRPGGLLLFHITNRYLDLSPVLRGLAESFGLDAVHLRSEADPEAGTNGASWALLTRNRAFLDQPEIRQAISPWPGPEPLRSLVWTDDFAGLWQVLKR